MKYGGNVLFSENSREIQNFGSMTKKMPPGILADESEKFLWKKVKLEKFSV